jgi:hypothetical protein
MAIRFSLESPVCQSVAKHETGYAEPERTCSSGDRSGAETLGDYTEREVERTEISYLNCHCQ